MKSVKYIVTIKLDKGIFHSEHALGFNEFGDARPAERKLVPGSQCVSDRYFKYSYNHRL